jgi:hypothetical protein
MRNMEEPWQLSKYSEWATGSMTGSRDSVPSRAGRVYLFCAISKHSLGLCPPPVQLVSGIFRPGVRWLEWEASSEVNARCRTATHVLNSHGYNIAVCDREACRQGKFFCLQSVRIANRSAAGTEKLLRTSIRHTAGMAVTAVVFKPSCTHMYRLL